MAHAEAHAEHAPAGAAERPHPHYKQYWIIISILTVLTVVEVAIAQPAIRQQLPHVMFFTAMIGLALAKAGLVGLYFMHLRYETRILRWTVIGPLATPFIYAMILIGEALWRLHVTQGVATWLTTK